MRLSLSLFLLLVATVSVALPLHHESPGRPLGHARLRQLRTTTSSHAHVKTSKVSSQAHSASLTSARVTVSTTASARTPTATHKASKTARITAVNDEGGPGGGGILGGLFGPTGDGVGPVSTPLETTPATTSADLLNSLESLLPTSSLISSSIHASAKATAASSASDHSSTGTITSTTFTTTTSSPSPSSSSSQSQSGVSSSALSHWKIAGVSVICVSVVIGGTLAFVYFDHWSSALLALLPCTRSRARAGSEQLIPDIDWRRATWGWSARTPGHNGDKDVQFPDFGNDGIQRPRGEYDVEGKTPPLRPTPMLEKPLPPFPPRTTPQFVALNRATSLNRSTSLLNRSHSTRSARALVPSSASDGRVSDPTSHHSVQNPFNPSPSLTPGGYDHAHPHGYAHVYPSTARGLGLTVPYPGGPPDEALYTTPIYDYLHTPNKGPAPSDYGKRVSTSVPHSYNKKLHLRPGQVLPAVGGKLNRKMSPKIPSPVMDDAYDGIML